MQPQVKKTAIPAIIIIYLEWAEVSREVVIRRWSTQHTQIERHVELTMRRQRMCPRYVARIILQTR